MQKSCRKNKAYYSAPKANAAHYKSIKDAHSGVCKTPKQLREIAELIEPLIAKGQSLNHICSTHADELGISERTLYNYIDKNVFKVRNIDLPKKVVYRQRRPKRILTKLEYQYRQGRTIEDFNSYVEANPDISLLFLFLRILYSDVNVFILHAFLLYTFPLGTDLVAGFRSPHVRRCLE